MTSIVPLQMAITENDTEHIWKNTRPSSTRYCRALKFEFTKETPDVIRAEKNRVDEQIKSLHESKISFISTY